MAKSTYVPQGKGLDEPGATRKGAVNNDSGGLVTGKAADKWLKQYKSDNPDYTEPNLFPVDNTPAVTTPKVSTASKVVAQQTKTTAQPKAPAAPKQSFLNKVGDVFKANTPQDQAKRVAAGQPAQFSDQQKQKKQAASDVKNLTFTPDELAARKDFYQQNGINIDDAIKQKAAYDNFKVKYKGQSLAKLTLAKNPDLLAAQKWEDTQKKIADVEKKYQVNTDPELQREKGVVTGALSVGGSLVTVPAEAINEKIVKPFVSSPAAALGGAAADATSGKGFDFRKQYQAAQHEANPIKQGAQFVDKKLGTTIAPSVDYADKNPVEALGTTALVAADVASDGALTPFITPALTAYYGKKYVQDLPANLKNIQNEKDPNKKYSMATQTILGGILLAKGAKDTTDIITKVPGAVKSIPTTKESTVETTVPHEQARAAFSGAPNEDLTPETTNLLIKAMQDNKPKFVSELKEGNGVTVQQTATVPTVYGKLLDIIQKKLTKGQKLSVNEEGVVSMVNRDPEQFVKSVQTKDLIPFGAKPTPPEAIAPAAAAPTVEAPSPVVTAPEPAPAPVVQAPAKPAEPLRANAVVDPELVKNKITGSEIAHTPISRMTLGADTLHTDIDQKTVQDYVDTIKAGKPITPVVISRGKDGEIIVHDGKHRLEALKKTGHTHAPVVEKIERPKGAVKPLGSKPTAELKYPATEDLPAHLKNNVPLDQKKLMATGEQVPKEKLTVREAGHVGGQDIGWERTKVAELLKLVPALKENPIMTLKATSEGMMLQAKVGSHEMSIPARSLGLSDERMTSTGLKTGDTVDISGAAEKGASNVPVIKKGKTMFSGTSGGNAKPKAEPKPEESNPVKEEPAAEPAKAAPSNVVTKFLAETKKHRQIAGALDDKLHALGGNSVADNIALNHLFKAAKELKATPEDWAAVYHYAEDRSAPITPEQKELYDTTIKPLQDGINDMRTDMGLKPFKNDEFVHRIAQGKGSSLERYLEGDNKDISPGNVLKKTSDSMKTRTWMKLVDGEGHSRIVSIKSPKNKLGKALGERQVTAFSNGKKTPMGALKRKIPTPTKEFRDPVLMEQLEKVAKDLGINHQRTNIPLKRGDTAAGVHYGGTNVVKTKSSSPPDVLLHEIGHYIDHKYDLQGQFLGRIKDQSSPAAKEEQRTITQELRDLADKRVGDTGSKSYSKYVRTGEEKMAVMFQAYLHAPEIFKAVAPTTFEKFEGFLKSNPETKGIANIEKSLQLASETIGDVRHEGEFIDKTGKKWKIVNATTKEIEDNTDTRYYKQPLVSTAIDYMQTRQALRAAQFLDTWKESPDFLYKEHEDGTTTGIAVKSDAKTIPEGFKTTSAPQFRGYHFEPRTAEVLDDFAKTAAKGDPLGAFTGANLFLRNTIFYNPLMHVPNIMWHAVMRRGLSGIANPVRAVRGVSSSIQAINEIVHEGDLYRTMLREGAPLMSFDRQALTKMIGQMMDDTIQDDKAVTTLAKLAGYANKANFIKAWYKVSSGVTWGSHDFFMMQAMIEEMRRGLTPQEAIHEVTAHIPDYRVPTRLLGSRSLKTTLSNHNVTMFLPYHYGIFKSYANTVREMAGYAPRGGKQDEGFTGRVKTSARGVDKLLMAGLIMFLIYPELDRIAKSIFGDDNAVVRRAGPFTFPYAVYQMLHGDRSPQSTASLVLPTPPGTKGFVQLVRNRDDLNRQIWNPGDAFRDPAQAAKDIGHFVAGTVAPLNTAQRAQKGSLKPKQFIENLAGVQSPNVLKNKVQNLYSKQLNLGVQSKAQQRISAAKNDARDQIAAGQGDSKAKALVANGTIKQSALKAFEKTASWTPLQRTFDNLTAVNKLAILQDSSPKDWDQLGDAKTIKADALKTSKDTNATGANRAAAGDIVKIMEGKNDFTYTSGQQTTNQSVLSSIGAYASAFRTSPATAFNRIFTGQRIIRTNSGAIIVERMPVGASQGIKQKLGGKNSTMKLDHTVPLELGGSNDSSNLKLVTTATWASYTPVEDYLGKQLKAGKINAKTAQKEILAFKNGTKKASDIIGH